MKKIAAILLLLATMASCQARTVFYHPESITVTSLQEEATSLKMRFNVVERGKFYDCPEVRVEKTEDRIDLLFVRKPVGEVKTPISSLTVGNPERLPVYVSNRKESIRIWPAK